MQTKDIPLHDIKPLIEIQEYSLYYFSALVFIASVVVLVLVYLLYKYIKNKNSFNIRAEYLKQLKAVDLSNPKRAAYEITLYGALFEADSEEHKKLYSALVKELETYKYKKDVDSFSEETKHSIKNYVGILNV
ncbi:hypothetical protein JHD47_01225 [Sulfurimonas sp. SAG-AH-194-L11]|nr:hypothetical protein [Sulfurimonas sp. SAG-AH-194-L11]MDF1876437.1 hypothetical protein [Sulfurimonas sp. SAG-AH-194-L11]